MLALVTISVFGLFHPVELEVQPARGCVLAVVSANGARRILEGSESAHLDAPVRVTGRGGAEASFLLSVPGKIQREFRGTLEVRRQQGHLLAIVTMDLETAVASIVAAEGPGAPMEALKAQAVVARSFLLASHGRHAGYDFCDTTHCQYLKGPPAARSRSKRAQETTLGMTLEYQGRVLAALYSANCGGRTRSLAEAGWRVDGYPYFAVDCPAHGAAAGHRIGMCQTGAAWMARHGAGFRDILALYFPAAVVAPAAP